MNKKLYIRFFSVILAILLMMPMIPASADDPGSHDAEEGEIPTVAEPTFDGDAKV